MKIPFLLTLVTAFFLNATPADAEVAIYDGNMATTYTRTSWDGSYKENYNERIIRIVDLTEGKSAVRTIAFFTSGGKQYFADHGKSFFDHFHVGDASTGKRTILSAMSSFRSEPYSVFHASSFFQGPDRPVKVSSTKTLDLAKTLKGIHSERHFSMGPNIGDTRASVYEYSEALRLELATTREFNNRNFSVDQAYAELNSRLRAQGYLED